MSVQQSAYTASGDQHNNTTMMSCSTEEERACFEDFTETYLPPPSPGCEQRIADTVNEVANGKSGAIVIKNPRRKGKRSSRRRPSPLNFTRASLVPNMFMGPFCAKMNTLSVQEREELERPYIANLHETVRRHKLLRERSTDETMASTTVLHTQLQAEAPNEKRKRGRKPKSIDQARTTTLNAHLQAEAPKEKRKRGRRPKSVNQVDDYWASTTVLHAQHQAEAPKEKRKRGRKPKSIDQVRKGVPYAELQGEALKEKKNRGREPKPRKESSRWMRRTTSIAMTRGGLPYVEPVLRQGHWLRRGQLSKQDFDRDFAVRPTSKPYRVS
ncbi:unnamed protein product [Angiostrongylus costaricensis]|uniref:Uncharacterized protein n=1 Tax=Angiostrongylus costaricensis TaxID=334426 RepID=A0A0R3PG36_ANGCS|nr:unnamed protein product [Angiostrongylus costaricensis]